MPPVSTQTLLIRRWLQRFFFFWLLTPLFLLFCSLLAVNIHFIFMLPACIPFAFWPAFLARAAVELAPRRTWILLVLPALMLIITLVTFGSMASIEFVVALYTHRHRGLANLLLDAAVPSLFTGIFVGIFTTAIWLLMPRDKPPPRFYHCAKCGYMLQGSLHAPRCPECGHVLELGLDYPYLPQHLEALQQFSQSPSIAAEDDD